MFIMLASSIHIKKGKIIMGLGLWNFKTIWRGHPSSLIIIYTVIHARWILCLNTVGPLQNFSFLRFYFLGLVCGISSNCYLCNNLNLQFLRESDELCYCHLVWRSLSLFILTLPFLLWKHLLFPLLSSSLYSSLQCNTRVIVKVPWVYS